MIQNPFFPEPGHKLLCPGRIRQIRLAQENHTALSRTERVNVRISAAYGDPGIHQFDHKIHKTDVFLHHPPCLCHMSRIPLYIHVFLLYQCLPLLKALQRPLRQTHKRVPCRNGTALSNGDHCSKNIDSKACGPSPFWEENRPQIISFCRRFWL